MGQKLYVCVGGQGSSFNYGNKLCPSPALGWSDPHVVMGAGATDIRLDGNSSDCATNWYGVKSRIMVAAGGGSGWYTDGRYYSNSAKGSAGGTISSLAVSTGISSPIYGSVIPSGSATQTHGASYQVAIGNPATHKVMYQAGFGKFTAEYQPAGGGGGYYMGACSLGNGMPSAGSGGSSFISGYPGCNAIAANSTENNIIHTGQPNHYSGFVFKNGYMASGDEIITEPDGSQNLGHQGNGFSRIVFINK